MRPIAHVTPIVWLLAIGMLVPLFAAAHDNPDASAPAAAANDNFTNNSTNNTNDFPTLARVEYVLRCMDYHGGQVYENMYSCVCSIDRIATEFSYDDFVKAEVLAQLRTTPGERGGLFREGGRELVSKYLEVTEAAETSCFSS